MLQQHRTLRDEEELELQHKLLLQQLHTMQHAPQHATQHAPQHAMQYATQHAKQHAPQHAPQHATQHPAQHATQHAPQHTVQQAKGRAPQHTPLHAPLHILQHTQQLFLPAPPPPAAPLHILQHTQQLFLPAPPPPATPPHLLFHVSPNRHPLKSPLLFPCPNVLLPVLQPAPPSLAMPSPAPPKAALSLVPNTRLTWPPAPNLEVVTSVQNQETTRSPPLRQRRRKGGAVQQRPDSQSGGEVGGTGECAGRAGPGVIQQGKRSRKLSEKARALQEAVKDKVEAKKKAAAKKRARTQKSDSLQPHTASTEAPPTAMDTPSAHTPPAVVASSPETKNETSSPLAAGGLTCPPLRLNASPLPTSVLLQNTTPPGSSPPPLQEVPSTQTITVAPPHPPNSPVNPVCTLTNQKLVSSVSRLSPATSNKDDSTPTQPSSAPSQTCPVSCQPDPAPKQTYPISCQTSSAPSQPSKAQIKGRKRMRVCVGGAGGGEIQEGKRVRKQSQKARALQKAAEAKAEAQKKRRTRSSCQKRARPPLAASEEKGVAKKRTNQLLLPRQSTWILTPNELVQLAKAPPHGLQLTFVPNAHQPAPPMNVFSPQKATPTLQLYISTVPSASSVPHRAALPVPQATAPSLSGQLLPLPAPPTCPSQPHPPKVTPPCILGSLHQSPSPSQPSLQLLTPGKETIRVDPAATAPLRRDVLQFDPTLMFLEPTAAVCDWLSGRRGVVVSGLDVALPYLPPFVCSLSALSALLRAKKALTKSSVQLLRRGAKPTTQTTNQTSADLPDSTSDVKPAQRQAPDLRAKPSQEDEEAELVIAVRQLVAERFAANPAYQLLKARFLSCFTVPAFLATMQPIKLQTVPRVDSVEEEEEEEEEVNVIKERGRRRRAERSSLLCDGPGAPANHFCGIINHASSTNQSRPSVSNKNT
ncbi:hypothetical protein LDENG_00242150 [Lucifuga dentata]|nr:hypothetical protein LDENG_00242150 [Lucifuga dentata]